MGRKRKYDKTKIEMKIKRLRKKLMTIESDSDSNDSTASEPHLPPEELEEPVIEQLMDIAVDTQLDEGDTITNPLDEEVLLALGSIEESTKGPIAHTEIANRWGPILAKGLTKEVKSDLLKRHIAFENIQMLPPKLNPEIAAAITEPMKKRDSIIEQRQRQVGAALAALGECLELFLKKGDKLQIITHVNDAAKILCDTIYMDTSSRRSLISATISKDMKGCLSGAADSLLFGSDLSEKIRTAKAVQRSVKDLKSTDVPMKTNKTRQPTLNWRGPPRATTRTTAAGGRPYRQTTRQQGKEDKRLRQPFRNQNNNTRYRR